MNKPEKMSPSEAEKLLRQLKVAVSGEYIRNEAYHTVMKALTSMPTERLDVETKCPYCGANILLKLNKGKVVSSEHFE